MKKKEWRQLVRHDKADFMVTKHFNIITFLSNKDDLTKQSNKEGPEKKKKKKLDTWDLASRKLLKKDEQVLALQYCLKLLFQ